MNSKHIYQKHEPAKSITRRSFLQKTTTTMAAAGIANLSTGFALGKTRGANERLGIGLIGAGHRGCNHLQALDWLKNHGSENIEVVAICDTYRPRLDKQAKFYNAQAYTDFRELLANPNVDIVCIATPDHQHALQSIEAIHAGKHVYSEKPISHWSQFEITKKLREVADKSDCCYLAGTQRMSSDAWKQARDLIKDGAIGQPIYAECEYFRCGDDWEFGLPIDDPNAKAGPDLNWEAFLGNAPKVPFDVSRYFRWRMYEDYAGGPVTDLYPHFLTQIILMLGVTFPKTVVGTGGIYRYEHRREVPDTFNMIIDYPEKIALVMKGSQGAGKNLNNSMPVIRGYEGIMTFNDYKEIIVTPYDSEKSKEPRKFQIKAGPNLVDYWRRFLNCIRLGDKQTDCPVDLAYYTQVACQMAYMSYKQGLIAKYDKRNEQIIL